MPDIEEVVDLTRKPLDQQPAHGKIINAEVSLQQDKQLVLRKVKRRALGPDGHVVGKYDNDPRLNSIIYEVEFPDGQVKDYAANVIAENMITQVDSEGFSMTMLDSIVDSCKDQTAFDKSDKYIVTRCGRKKLRKTTQGWKLLVHWKDGSKSWLPLKDLKESHPVEVAEYAKTRGIDDESAFA
eukprot:5303891-Ditylum_brightwellii.AAC.1